MTAMFVTALSTFLIAVVYAASPVAADGRLFVTSEDGDIFVVRAGRTNQEIAKNQMKEVIMSTPAISDGMMFIRTLGHVYAVGGK
jgi:outer membrane protein assembly factor BamB